MISNMYLSPTPVPMFPPVAVAAVHSKVVVMLLLIHCLVLLSCCMLFMLVPCIVM